MLVDADFMSYLNDDVEIDPLMKDYLSFARQSYIENPPADGSVTKDNLPGRRKKRDREEM